MSNKSKTLVINIADKVFKIKLENQDEFSFLEEIKKINLKIKEYKETYPGLYLQEYLSMVLIFIASDKQQIESKNLNNILTQINKLENKINEQIDEN